MALQAKEFHSSLSAPGMYWRIAEMERQIKSVNGTNGLQRIDQTTINRAVTGAVNRERVEWQRKMEKSRARFQRLSAALVSTRRSLSKIQKLLEESEREWLPRRAWIPRLVRR
jgi:hypothetical protein